MLTKTTKKLLIGKRGKTKKILNKRKTLLKEN